MLDGPVIASIASLIGDPARANVLTALMDGRALTVSELAQAAGVSLPTTSGHLAKLAEAGLLTAERQGRHRYFRLSGPDVALVLETLMNLAERTGQRRLRTGPSDPALRRARVCYDHLAGEYAVALLDSFIARDFITAGPQVRLT
jgi:DNA-binding transcriptional ArsR family regulator